GADALEDEIGEYGAGDDRVDTFRIEPLDAQPLAAVRLAQRPADPGDFLRGGDDVMQMTLGGFAALIPGNGHQVEHGSRGSHHAAYVAGGETREHRIELFRQVVLQGRQVLGLERIAGDELLAQSGDADLETVQLHGLRIFGQNQLDAAATDVDDERRV